MANRNNSTEVNDYPQKCRACKISFPDIYSYAEHLESKEHTKVIMKQKYGKKYLEAKDMLEGMSSSNDIKTTSTDINTNHESRGKKSEDSNLTNSSSGDSDDEDEVYTCDICKKICTGLLNYKLHLAGSKHLKKIKEMKTMKELEEKKLVQPSYGTPDMELRNQFMTNTLFASSELVCAICNVKCTGPQVLQQHIKGEAHKKREAKQQMQKEMEAKGLHTIPDLSSEEIGNSYSCETCSKSFSGIVPYKQHLESVNHQKQERDNQRLAKNKDLYIPSPTNSKLQCVECKKFFSGPAPFEEHLKSSLHGKLKKKTSLYEELEKNYPEMIKTSVNLNSESEDSDDEVKPACGVCNMIFSGPEAALDHFSSVKHKKALKKKLHIQKNKSKKKAENILKNASLKIEHEGNIDEKAENSDEDDFEKISI